MDILNCWDNAMVDDELRDKEIAELARFLREQVPRRLSWGNRPKPDYGFDEWTLAEQLWDHLSDCKIFRQRL